MMFPDVPPRLQHCSIITKLSGETQGLSGT